LSLRFRLIGVAAYDLQLESQPVQGMLFEEKQRKKNDKLDRALDTLRERFGKEAVQRGSDMGMNERFGLPLGKMPED